MTLQNLDTVKKRILDACSLETLIGERVSLKKNAGHYIGLCPFHEEKTPSFHVFDDHYHCFGCSAHGDAISFTRHDKGLGFIESLRWIAEKFQVDAPELDKSREDQAFYKKSLRKNDILAKAQEIFAANLREPAGDSARKVLEERGFDPSFIKEQGFGFAIGRSQIQRALEKAGFTKQELIDSSLLSRTDKGRFVDFFFDRITVPIRDHQGRLIAFGGRAMTSDAWQKYKNSRYDKNQVLFGLDRARQEIKKKGRAILVEGYMDALQLWQNDLRETVACQGTSFTREQMRRLERTTSLVYLLFDGDDAGLAAAERTLDLSFEFPNLEYRVVSLPRGEDPDSFVRKHGHEGVEDLLSKASSLLDWAVSRRLSAAHGTDLPHIMKSSIAPWISSIGDPLTKALLLAKVSDITGLTQDLILSLITAKHPERQIPEQVSYQYPSDPQPSHAQEPLVLDSVQKEMIGHLYFLRPSDPVEPAILDYLAEHHPFPASAHALVTHLVETHRSGKAPRDQDKGFWATRFGGEIAEYLFSLEELAPAFEVPERGLALERLANIAKRKSIKATIKSLKSRLFSVQGDQEAQRTLLESITQLHRQLNKLSLDSKVL